MAERAEYQYDVFILWNWFVASARQRQVEPQILLAGSQTLRFQILSPAQFLKIRAKN